MPKTRIKDYQINSERLDQLTSQVEEMDMLEDGLNMSCLIPDPHGIFTRVEWRRPDNTLYRVSQLSGGTSPEYSTRTVTYYEADGTSVRRQFVYALSYSQSGELVQETLQDT